MEKTVKLKLFKDNGQYKDDVFVAVNGRTFQIVRGGGGGGPAGVAEGLELSLLHI